jgi:uncharacterized membrane protein YhaH (DUF805 family)
MMMHWVFRPWRHAFKFSGRATRREYWLFQVQLLAAYLFAVLAMAFGVELSGLDLDGVMGIGSIGVFFLLCVASLAAGVRRVHDHDKTGWLFLSAFIPLIGWIFFLIMTLTPGTRGENSYGHDPREGDHPSADEVASIFA